MTDWLTTDIPIPAWLVFLWLVLNFIVRCLGVTQRRLETRLNELREENIMRQWGDTDD